MVQATSAQIGLLAFAVAVIAGASAGNTISFVLTRALLAMLVGAIVGQVAGWTAKVVLRDHLQRKKLEIDRLHFEAVSAMELAAGASETAEPADPVEVR